jgi:hypothetical protein
MNKKWTRRKFLKTGLQGSLAIGGAARRPLAETPPTLPAEGKASARGLDARQRETLRAAMDEIIPAGDGMPAASAVGGVEYLQRSASEDYGIQSDLTQSLAALEEISQKGFGKRFVGLSQADRVGALKALERQSPGKHFATLRDFVYEAYYTRPRVWKLIGYEFHPTNSAGPKMKPFDEVALAVMKKRPKFYREAS